MDKRQLDLNKPLLSVRRIPKLGYRSAMSGEVVQRSQIERYQVPPFSQYSDSNTMEQVTKPASVAFVWEHIPGRAKSKSGPLYFAQDEHHQLPSISPRFPPHGRVRKDDFDEMYVQKPQTRVPSPIIRARTMFERSDVKEYEKESSPVSENDETDEFADALDTLLPEETFSVNCSVSGLSGDEGSNANSSGNFSVDRQTQDFLMSRFLPAAKAMTLETPEYAIKKQPAAVEEPKHAKRLSNVERKPLPQLKHYESSIVPSASEEPGVNQSESDDESCDTPTNVSVKACGFLPKFYLKYSLAAINQMTGAKSRSQSPKVARSESRKVAKSPSNQPATPITDKNAWEASHIRILECKVEQQKLAEMNIDKQIEQYLKSNAAQEASRASPYNNSVRGNISPYRNQRSPSPFREGVGFLGIPKEAEKSNVNDGSFKFNYRAGSKFHDALPPVEKTLYMDFVNSVKKPENDQTEVVKREVEPVKPAKKKAVGPESIPHVMRRLKELSLSRLEATDSFIATRPSLSGISRSRDLDQSSFFKVSTEKKHAKDDTETNLALVASPLTPPLPKLPSESWLQQTLPSMPSKNPFSGLKRSLSRPSSPLAKWETIVKSSKLQNDHKRFSAELSSDVLRQYKK